jgi:chemotaxis protein CheD
MTAGSDRRRSLLQFADDGLEHVQVRIGDVRVGGQRSLLYTIGLGSCVVVALYDADRRIGGLAHAMLPEPSSGRRDAPLGRFATTAIPELVRLVCERGAARSRLRARITGGASMFRDVLEGDGLRLGRRNVEAARESLARLGIPVVAEDVLGGHGRSVFFRTTDGHLLVTSVQHDDVVL